MRKPDFCLCENKLISAFVFATRIVQFLFFLNPKFQASSLLLRLYSPVCVGPGWKSRRPVFTRRGSNRMIGDEFMIETFVYVIILSFEHSLGKHGIIGTIFRGKLCYTNVLNYTLKQM